MTAELREIITSIKDKTARLHAAYEKEKRKKYELTSKIQSLENENSELNEKIQKISQEFETIKLSKTLTNKETKEETKGQINTLIRDIDNCIALINKM
ncbi:MAG: hypothetical protein U9Q98_06725 [Bacteroidota bacterium]|nr:hypothetical protein [Bacteroidota bacterium]